MRFSSARRANGETKPPLTSMVDIVFLLLVFFVMTFHVVPTEGDFEVDFRRGEGEPRLAGPPVTVRIRPNPETSGGITISWQQGFGEQHSIRDMQTLNERAWDYKHGEGIMRCLGGPSDAVLDVDPRLEYRHTIDAMSALSARLENGKRTEIFRRISLSSRERATN